MQPPRAKWLRAEAANGLSHALGFPPPVVVHRAVDIRPVK